MLLLSKKDWSGYLVELVVVVLGILIAFQVDEWREQLVIKRDVNAALVRLQEETKTNIRNCEVFLPVTTNLARSVQIVLQSVQSGQLRDDDIGAFEYGLTHIGWLPARNYLTTVAEEMIATGLLKEIDSAGLQTSIASAMTQTVVIRQNTGNQSRFLQSVVHELARAVDYTYVGPSNVDNLHQPATMGAFEEYIEVTYDFETLAGNRYLKNLLFETTDGYFDLFRMNSTICNTIKDIDRQLAEHGID